MRLRYFAGTAIRAAAVAGLGAAAGCASKAPAPVAGAVNTGTYPNLNIIPQPAGTQISAEEKAAKMAQLGAAQGGQAAAGAAGGPTADEARLRQIAASHGDETLKAIEGQQ